MRTPMHPHLKNKKAENNLSPPVGNLHATARLSSRPCYPFLVNITAALPAMTCTAGRQGQDTFGAESEY